MCILLKSNGCLPSLASLWYKMANAAQHTQMNGAASMCAWISSIVPATHILCALFFYLQDFANESFLSFMIFFNYVLVKYGEHQFPPIIDSKDTGYRLIPTRLLGTQCVGF